MTEAELDAGVRSIVRHLPGLLAYHTYDSRRSAPGFPDWVFAGSGVLFRELKSAGGKLRPEQVVWLDALTEAGADAAVWRPADLTSGLIARTLAALAFVGSRSIQPADS